MADENKTAELMLSDNGYETIHSKSELFYDWYERKSELQHQTHYCPGCGHGVAHKLIAEALSHTGNRFYGWIAEIGRGGQLPERGVA